jgi:hypothetical protein
MIKHYFIFIFILASLAGCRSKTKTTQTSSQPACKVLISFGSRGDGINEKKLEELSTVLNNRKVKYSQKVAGREGEKEICVPLNELSGKEKTDFIEQLKTFQDPATFVSVSVN